MSEDRRLFLFHEYVHDHQTLTSTTAREVGKFGSVMEHIDYVADSYALLHELAYARKDTWSPEQLKAALDELVEVMLGGVGAIVGCVAGVVIGAATILLGGSRLDSLPLPPPTILVAALAIGILVPVVAAIYPARAAGRIPIVRAVAYR